MVPVIIHMQTSQGNGRFGSSRNQFKHQRVDYLRTEILCGVSNGLSLYQAIYWVTVMRKLLVNFTHNGKSFSPDGFRYNAHHRPLEMLMMPSLKLNLTSRVDIVCNDAKIPMQRLLERWV